MEQLYTEHNVGQEIVIERSGNYRNFYTLGYKIAKVTKSRVIVERGEGNERCTMAFRNYKFGKEVGSTNDFRANYLSDLTPEQYKQREEKDKRTINAISALREVRVEPRVTYHKDTLVEMVKSLEAKLEAARDAVNAI